MLTWNDVDALSKQFKEAWGTPRCIICQDQVIDPGQTECSTDYMLCRRHFEDWRAHIVEIRSSGADYADSHIYLDWVAFRRTPLPMCTMYTDD